MGGLVVGRRTHNNVGRSGGCGDGYSVSPVMVYAAMYFLSQELSSIKSKFGFLKKLCLSVLFLFRFLLVRFPETCMKMNWYHSLRKLVQFGICASWWILFLVKTEVTLSLLFVVKMQHRKQSNWWVTYFQTRQDDVNKHTCWYSSDNEVWRVSLKHPLTDSKYYFLKNCLLIWFAIYKSRFTLRIIVC